MVNAVDVLLLFPSIKKVSTSYRSSGSPPIGLAYLAAICQRDGYSVRFHDLNVEKLSPRQLGALMGRCRPRVVGVSFVTEARFEAFDFLKLAKSVDPSVVTVAGGPHASLCADDTLKHVPELDVIVRGEGEATFSELMSALADGQDLSHIKGLSYRQEGAVRHNQARPRITDLDALPFPALDLMGFERYDSTLRLQGHGVLKIAPVLTSRGCPFRCNFCATSEVWGSRWRFRSPPSIVAEIEQLKDKYDIQAIWFVDDNFNASTKRTASICKLLMDKDLDLKWVCNIRVDNLARDHLEMMAAAGCISVEFGAESGVQRILDDVVRKGITVEQIARVDRWCSELGIVSDAQFIISHPTETPEEAQQTVRLMRSLKGKSTLQILKIYPGTDIEKIASHNGLLPKGFSWSRDRGKTDSLSSITGAAPLFLDGLTMQEISELMAAGWTEVGSFSTFYLVKKILSQVRSVRELCKLIKLGAPVLLRKCKGAFSKRREGGPSGL